MDSTLARQQISGRRRANTLSATSYISPILRSAMLLVGSWCRRYSTCILTIAGTRIFSGKRGAEDVSVVLGGVLRINWLFENTLDGTKVEGSGG